MTPKLTIPNVCETLEREHGYRPSTATVWGWTRDGLLTPDGERVRLPTSRVGARLLVDRADLDGFLAAVSGTAEVAAS